MSVAGCYSSVLVSTCVCVFADCPELTPKRLQDLKKFTIVNTLTLKGEQASLISGQGVRELDQGCRTH